MSSVRRAAVPATLCVPPRQRRLPLAIAEAMVLWTLLAPAVPAAAGVLEITGVYWIDPPDALAPAPGRDFLPDVRLWLGARGAGTLTQGGGQAMTLGGLFLAAGNGSAVATIDGANTHLSLWSPQGRLAVGDFGDGRLTVSNGATIDGLHDSVACRGAGNWCGAIVGAAAGSTGVLTLTDRGTSASFLSGVSVGTTHLDPDYGIPGGTTNATLNVLNGAVLNSDAAFIADNFASVSGAEAVNGWVTIDGSGSAWNIGNQGSVRALFEAGNHAHSVARVDITRGGVLTIAAVEGDFGLNLGIGGGYGEMHVTGTGSTLQMAAGSAVNIGTWGTGNGSLWIEDGATLIGGGQVRLGESEGSGVLVVSGPGARALFDAGSTVHIGAYDNGYGMLTVREGGRLSAGQLRAGDGGSGHIIVRGAGSRIDTSFPAGPGNDIWIGMNGYGQLSVTDGGAVAARGIAIGNQAIADAAGGTGNVTVRGAGSTITVDATAWHRLGLERGTLTVSEGGLFDAATGLASCRGTWCGAFIGANAGADANVIVTGSGSRAAFASDFRVGAAYATKPPATSYVVGVPGAATRATVSVLEGGRLETSSVLAGLGSSGNAALGNELVDVRLLIQGEGSTWAVTGIPGASSATWFDTGATSGGGSAANTTVSLQILQGGALQLGQPGQRSASLALGRDAGRSTALVSGTGSVIEFLAVNNALAVGRGNAFGSLAFTQGAQLLGANWLAVGTLGGIGELGFDASHATMGSWGIVSIGEQGGTGQLGLTNGAVFDFGSGPQFATLRVGHGGTATVETRGSLSIDSNASLRMMSSKEALNADGDRNYNPQAFVGAGGTGVLTVQGGGSLLLHGQLTQDSDGVDPSTSLWIGYASTDDVHASHGTVLVGGAASSLEVIGHNASIDVGTGGRATGHLTVQDGASVRTTQLRVGNGGSGGLNVAGGEIALTGQFSNGNDTASLLLGTGERAFGSANLTGGSTLSISNSGNAAAGLIVGSQGGTGVLNVTGGSRIAVRASPGAAFVTIGGGAGSAGVVRLDGAGLDVGDGSVTLAGAAGGNASLTLAGQATLQAGFVGVGSSPQGDGGNAVLVVDDSRLTAGVVEIGSQGYVSGSGVIDAAVINRGVINPGNSPGTLTIDGGFQNQGAGQLVLEIGTNASGAFVTDHLLFVAGNTIGMSDLRVTFSFLGATDPNAFLASGAFDIDRFIAWQDGAALDHTLFDDVSYTARSAAYRFQDFQFSADGGASYVATPVPEPAAWLMLLAGMAGLAGVARWRGRPTTEGG